jgi:putative phosphoesterase
MIIGIISDTHDKLDIIDAAFEFFKSKNVSLVLHCGDWKSLETIQYFAGLAAKNNMTVKGVLGNNDTEVSEILQYSNSAPGNFDLKEGVLGLEIGVKKLAIYHGHHAPTLRRLKASKEYDFICLGHTHKPKIETNGNTLLINPGSTAFAIPRSREWKPTVVLLDIEKNAATIQILPLY